MSKLNNLSKHANPYRGYDNTGDKKGLPESHISEIAYFEPEIPGNTGAAIRLCAVTGSRLHLIEPLGFDLDQKKLRRAGLDYHDLTSLIIHESFDSFLDFIGDRRIVAFTTQAKKYYTDENYTDNPILLFGPESVGLPDEIKHHERVDCEVRIPMLPHLRSLNLTNSASIAIYEAWRQHGFSESV